MNKCQYILAAVAILLLSSCIDNTLFIEPVADFEIEQGDKANLYEPVTFNITGQGNRITLYAGEEGSNYDNGDIGVVLRSGDSYKHSYSTLGTFDVVMLVTSFNENGDDFVSKIERKQITIESGPDYQSTIERVRLMFRGASIKCNADKVTGLEKEYVFSQNQLIKYADVVNNNGTYNCVAYTNYYNRMWPDVQLFPGLPLYNPHPDQYKIEIRTENDHPGIDVRIAEAYYLPNRDDNEYFLLNDTLINVNRAQSFWFNKSIEQEGKNGGGYMPVVLKSETGLSGDNKLCNLYILPYPEMRSFRIDGVSKEGNDEIRMDPTHANGSGSAFNNFYSIFNIDENTSLVPTFTTVLSSNVVVTDDTGKVIKGDGTDDPINFFGSEPVTFTLTYTDPDFPEGYNKSVAYYTVITD